jgi:hypothetical protein
MKKIINIFSATLVCLLLNQTAALASSHREAPLMQTIRLQIIQTSMLLKVHATQIILY